MAHARDRPGHADAVIGAVTGPAQVAVFDAVVVDEGETVRRRTGEREHMGRRPGRWTDDGDLLEAVRLGLLVRLDCAGSSASA